MASKSRYWQVFPIALAMVIWISHSAWAEYAEKTGVPSDTLTIKVGYFGGPYHTKKVYTLSEIEALSPVQQAYTFIDRMPSVCIDSARGLGLKDLLDDAGIDVNSVETFYFYSTDMKDSWYACLTKSYLLDTTRYYYPHLPECWDSHAGSPMPGAAYGAIPVDTIMAIEDNWQRFAVVPDFAHMSGDSRFRLVFGQEDVSSCIASRSAMWVHVIEVMLGGTPPAGVTLDQETLNLKVGSTFRLQATIEPFEATDKSVTWSSSDISVATVDDSGLVSVVGPGNAVITVSTVVGNMSASCSVNDPGEVVAPEVVETGTEADENEAQEQNLSAGGTVAGAGISLSESGRQPWRVYKMSADAVPLPVQEKKNILDVPAAVLFIFLLLYGSGRKYHQHKKEIAR